MSPRPEADHQDAARAFHTMFVGFEEITVELRRIVAGIHVLIEREAVVAARHAQLVAVLEALDRTLVGNMEHSGALQRQIANFMVALHQYQQAQAPAQMPAPEAATWRAPRGTAPHPLRVRPPGVTFPRIHW